MKPNAKKARRSGINQWSRKKAHSLLARIITTWTAGSLGVLFLLFFMLAAVSTAPMTSPTVQAFREFRFKQSTFIGTRDNHE